MDSVWISSSPLNCRHQYPDQEDYQQKQRDFPNPHNWRNGGNRYTKSDHANTNYRVVTALHVSLFISSEKRASPGT
jgi:hypothetical protein